MSRLAWYLKQLLPFTYVSNYGDADGQKVCVWRMWFGHVFAVREWLVVRQVHPVQLPEEAALHTSLVPQEAA